MQGFHLKNGSFYCESVELEELAKEFGTPLYIYSEEVLKNNCQQFLNSFSAYPTKICYAVKANYNLSILKKIFQFGMGADVVSIGELERAIKSGVSLDKVVFSGVGKTKEELDRAISLGIASLNVESSFELELIKQISEQKKQNISVALRINPNIDVKTNPYIATGLYETKFGIPDEDLESVAEIVKGHRFVQFEGLACHIGSQIMELKSFELAAKRLVDLAYRMKERGFPIRRIDLGGGLGISYQQGQIAPSIRNYAESILKVFRDTPFELVLEPGRSVVGAAGVLLTTILGTKKHKNRHFTIVDAAMNDLIRPCLYEAYHEIVPVKAKAAPEVITDVVGPVCETGDFLGLSRTLASPSSGELLFIKNAGAYGTTMSSNYNARPRCAEVLVSGNEVTVIRRRESVAELWHHEI
ncbi:MAG: diaminopimelate decarboxylase [Proteobacteria bacterium]|nr:diaminopimelate decarboxylase [Pseudomonadota bacterium]